MNYLRTNIEYFLDKYKTNPNDLEQKNPRIKQSTIFRIQSGATKDPRRSTLEPFAEWAGVSVSDLFEVDFREIGNSSKLDNNVDLSQKIAIEGRPIPVISWVQAGSWTGVESVPRDTEFNEWLPPNADCGKNGYALVVKGLSMSPKFEPEDRIYVNPDIQTFDLKTNDLVIVSCTGDNETTFKKLIIESDEKYLQPLNPLWQEKIMQLTEDCRLVGKVVGLYRKI
ncbi:LexA family protein [Acinetobacter bohemicus]|uniref:LexA family protein n=1 Tax=Acinetobacter bohemicus TaxID=1435036 RepID=UPI0040425B3D